jgi:DNA-directed RNA polymerase alpha subunit
MKECIDMVKTILASKIKVGMQIPETDGFLFEVKEIVKETEKSITVRLTNDTCIDKNLWSENGGIIKPFRKSTKIYIQTAKTELDLLLQDNEISQRTFNTLKRAGYNTLEEIRDATAKAIQDIYSMSKVSLKEINKCMLKYFSQYKPFEM